MNIRTRTTIPLLATLLTLLAANGLAATGTDDAARASITVQGLVSDGGASAAGDSSYDEFGPLALTGERDRPKRSALRQKSDASNPQKSALSNGASPNTDFWFYAASVELFGDRDRDGFHTGISLLFDADTYYESADVYAVAYLSYEYGEWNEYAETEIFTLFGASDVDEYVVDTDLVSGYPTGSYDILIELYDAYDDAFVASIGPEDTSELAILPLEDAERDSPVAVGTTQIVVSSGGGGSSGWFLMLALSWAALRARRR